MKYGRRPALLASSVALGFGCIWCGVLVSPQFLLSFLLTSLLLQIIEHHLRIIFLSQSFCRVICWTSRSPPSEYRHGHILPPRPRRENRHIRAYSPWWLRDWPRLVRIHHSGYWFKLVGSEPATPFNFAWTPFTHACYLIRAFYIVAFALFANFIAIVFFMPETAYHSPRPNINTTTIHHSTSMDKGREAGFPPSTQPEKMEQGTDLIAGSSDTETGVAEAMPKPFSQTLKFWSRDAINPNIRLKAAFLRPLVLLG